MKIKTYAEPGSTLAFAYGNETAHHWIIDVDGEEYVELITRLKDTKWNKRVAWYPKFFPSDVYGKTDLEAHIVAYDDRDATLLRLSL